jgi:carboxyl-terminal processing protease
MTPAESIDGSQSPAAARRRATPLIFAVLLLVTACGGTREYAKSDSPYALPPASTRFFTAAYDQIFDKYVRAVSLDEIADSGLHNLHKIDASFDIVRAGDKIVVSYGDDILANYDRPQRDDGYRWAQLTVAAIEAGRDRSVALRDADTEALYQNVVEGMLSKLDVYSRYSGRDSAREARASRDGFGGIGITIDGQNGKVRVASILDETPAAHAGLKVDDEIVGIDNESIAGTDTRDVVRRLRGAIGNTVNLSVSRPGVDKPLTFALTRALIIPPSVTYQRDGNIAHIRVLTFNQRTTETLSEAVRRAKTEIGPDLQGVIVDLRGNLGGLLDQAISTADLFLPEGGIVSTRGRHRNSGQSNTASKGDIGEEVPLVLLVNGASASASEIVAAALQDNGRAVVIGTTTFGKGTVQTVIPMPNDGELILTWAKFFSPSGYPIADLGVMPAVCTSAAKPAEAYVQNIRSGQLTTPATMADWRGADHQNMTMIKQLRGLCPPDTKEHDSDMDVARALLTDRKLYGQALYSVMAAKGKASAQVTQ